MRIGLTMRVVQADTYVEPRDAISQDWIRWLEKLGHIAMPIPNVGALAGKYLDAMNVDAVILTGGNDVIPQPNAEDDTAPDRTETEHTLINAAIANSLPILGACRGLHLLNLHFGGTVIDALGDHHNNHVACNHSANLDTYFSNLAEADSIEINSFHNQAVSNTELAQSLSAFAHSEDGLVEGLFHRTLPIIAVQWHPERPNPAADFDTLVFEKLLRDGAFWRETFQ